MYYYSVFLIQEVKLQLSGTAFLKLTKKESESLNFSQDEFLQVVMYCTSPKRIS